MHRMYQTLPQAGQGSVMVPHWARIQHGLRQSVEKIIDYRKTYPHSLDGNHPLVRMIDSIPVSKKLDLEIYHDKVIDYTFQLASMLRMTSMSSRGSIFSPGVFYGDNSQEAIICTIEPYDFNQMRSNWRSMRPIRVLYHPMSDLSLGVPDGSTRGSEGGPAVIVVNVPMLAAQHRMWSLEENSERRDSKRSVGQFLQQYTLPNMLYSHADIAIMNRLINRYFEVEMPQPKNAHSFFLVDWNDHTDRALDFWIEYWSKKNHWRFDDLISNMPMVFSSDLHKVIKAPEGAFSRQIQWATVLSRLALTTFLVQFNAFNENSANRLELSQLRIALRRMDSDKIMQSAMPRDMFSEVSSMIESGIVPYI